jgi:hypothetical protein
MKRFGDSSVGVRATIHSLSGRSLRFPKGDDNVAEVSP